MQHCIAVQTLHKSPLQFNQTKCNCCNGIAWYILWSTKQEPKYKIQIKKNRVQANYKCAYISHINYMRVREPIHVLLKTWNEEIILNQNALRMIKINREDMEMLNEQNHFDLNQFFLFLSCHVIYLVVVITSFSLSFSFISVLVSLVVIFFVLFSINSKHTRAPAFAVSLCLSMFHIQYCPYSPIE